MEYEGKCPRCGAILNNGEEGKIPDTVNLDSEGEKIEVNMYQCDKCGLVFFESTTSVESSDE